MSYTQYNKLSLINRTIPDDHRSKSHQVLPKHIAQKIARESSSYDAHKKSTGTFRCPNCHKLYSMTFSKFGKVGSFGDETYYCLDCVEVLDQKFIKL